MLELDGYGRRIQLERNPAGGGRAPRAMSRRRAHLPPLSGRSAAEERASDGCDQPC
jgi:hypothetical protein